jgi:hypothetical protein
VIETHLPDVDLAPLRRALEEIDVAAIRRALQEADPAHLRAALRGHDLGALVRSLPSVDLAQMRHALDPAELRHLDDEILAAARHALARVERAEHEVPRQVAGRMRSTAAAGGAAAARLPFRRSTRDVEILVIVVGLLLGILAGAGFALWRRRVAREAIAEERMASSGHWSDAGADTDGRQVTASLPTGAGEASADGADPGEQAGTPDEEPEATADNVEAPIDDAGAGASADPGEETAADLEAMASADLAQADAADDGAEPVGDEGVASAPEASDVSDATGEDPGETADRPA